MRSLCMSSAAEATSTAVTHPSAEGAIPPPPPEGMPRDYPQNIRSIVESISNLTLLETSQLNDLLKVAQYVLSLAGLTCANLFFCKGCAWQARDIFMSPTRIFVCEGQGRLGKVSVSVSVSLVVCSQSACNNHIFCH